MFPTHFTFLELVVMFVKTFFVKEQKNVPSHVTHTCRCTRSEPSELTPKHGLIGYTTGKEFGIRDSRHGSN